MNLQTTTIAYTCPSCGTGITKDLNIFSLSGGVTIPCKCGEELVIKVTSDKKILLSVPCMACPDPHSFKLSGTAFFERDLFVLQCPYTALDICFIGEHKKVIQSLNDNQKYLEEMLSGEIGSELDDDILKDMYDKYDNPIVMNDILLIIRDFIAENEVECDCSTTDNLEIDIGRDHVLLFCKRCGKKKQMRALTESDVDYLCELDKIILK